jgi:hypothetical protein
MLTRIFIWLVASRRRYGVLLLVVSSWPFSAFSASLLSISFCWKHLLSLLSARLNAADGPSCQPRLFFVAVHFNFFLPGGPSSNERIIIDRDSIALIDVSTLMPCDRDLKVAQDLPA